MTGHVLACQCRHWPSKKPYWQPLLIILLDPLLSHIHWFSYSCSWSYMKCQNFCGFALLVWWVAVIYTFSTFSKEKSLKENISENHMIYRLEEYCLSAVKVIWFWRLLFSIFLLFGICFVDRLPYNKVRLGDCMSEGTMVDQSVLYQLFKKKHKIM